MALFTRKPKRTRAIVASAEHIHLDKKDEAQRLRKKAEDWQDRAWGYLDEVPEVGYGHDQMGDAMAKLRMVPGVRDDPEEDPVPLQEALEAGQITEAEAAAAMDAVRRLDEGPGHSELFRNGALQLSAVGEGYLIGIQQAEEGGERWEFKSTDEVSIDSSGKPYLMEGEGTKRKRALEPGDFVGRIWKPHARKGWLATSPMRRLLNTCDELLILDRMARSTERSRNNAGILLMPEELDLASPDPTTESEEGDVEETLERKLLRSMVTPIQDEGSASAVVPHIVYGKAEHLDKVRHIDLAKVLADWFNSRQEALRGRLAAGMNWPAEAITGIGGVNHWGAWLIDDDKFKSHVEPLALLLLSGITGAYFRPMLGQMGVANPRRFVVWYDASKLVTRPNRGQDAKDLYDRWEISGKALRDATNFQDEDAPDEEEVQRRIRIEEAKAPRMGGPASAPTERPEPEETGPPDQGEPADDAPPPSGESTHNGNGNGRVPTYTYAEFMGRIEAEKKRVVDAALAERFERVLASGGIVEPIDGDYSKPFTRPVVAAAARGRDVAAIGARLTVIDQQLRERLLTGADASMRRALERAGARLVAKVKARKDETLKDMIKGHSNLEVAAILGARIVEQLGEDDEHLLAGAFDDLEPRFDRWVRQAQRQALALVPDLASTQQTEAERLQVQDRDEAWEWGQAALFAQARQRLYDPAPSAPARGEFDGSLLVGAGLVRGAMARAGGAEREGGDDGFALGAAAGLLIGRVLRENGVRTDGWQWTYGDYPREKPFEPHAALDGLVFERFDDPGLANTEGWPAEPFYGPGDHEGCVCDWLRLTAPVAT